MKNGMIAQTYMFARWTTIDMAGIDIPTENLLGVTATDIHNYFAPFIAENRALFRVVHADTGMVISPTTNEFCYGD